MDMGELEDLDSRIKALRTQRAIALTDLATTEARRVCPEAALMLFEGPQEPGGEAAILRLVSGDGRILYDLYEGGEGDGFNDDDLEEAQDLLTRALEDDGEIFAQGLGGNYVVAVPRV